MNAARFELDPETVRRVVESRPKRARGAPENLDASDLGGWARFLGALADPSRLALLDLLAAHPKQTWTARELADHIGMPTGSIYYHLNRLEQQGLLSVPSTRVVNHVVEKHYGASEFLRTHYARLQAAIGREGWNAE